MPRTPRDDDDWETSSEDSNAGSTIDPKTFAELTGSMRNSMFGGKGNKEKEKVEFDPTTGWMIGNPEPKPLENINKKATSIKEAIASRRDPKDEVQMSNYTSRMETTIDSEGKMQEQPKPILAPEEIARNREEEKRIREENARIRDVFLQRNKALYGDDEEVDTSKDKPKFKEEDEVKRKQAEDKAKRKQEYERSKEKLLAQFAPKKRAQPTIAPALPALDPELKKKRGRAPAPPPVQKKAASIIQRNVKAHLKRKADALLQSANKTVIAAGAITDEILHDITEPASSLQNLANNAESSANVLDKATDSLEVFVTGNFENIPKPEMDASSRLIELGDDIVKAAIEKAHAAKAAIKRNEAIEHARSALARTKAIEEASVKAKAKATTYTPEVFKKAEERTRDAIESARKELMAAHEEAKKREEELKVAVLKAKEAAKAATQIMQNAAHIRNFM